jgi:hypothetical protein
MSQIIRYEQEGIELFTVQATGESGMSQSGLAILAGVSQQAISKLEKTLTTKAPSEWLEFWVDKVKTLTTNSEFKNATIYGSGFCAAVIQHYAFLGNKIAIYSLNKFAGMGIDKWIQQQTGWDSTLTDLQNILLLAQNALAQHQQQHEQLAARTENLEELVHQHDGEVDRIFHPDGKYFSVRGYARKLKQQVTKQEASEKGRAAAKISRQLGIAIDKLEDPRYGEVNIYHESILEQVFI